MNSKGRIILGSLIFFVFVAGMYVTAPSLFLFPQTHAAISDNLSGWAWSSNIGWISFNCTNQGVCASSSYGVTVAPPFSGQKELSGYAWSSNIGWITFNDSELSGCPNGPCGALIDFSNGSVTGWARAYRCVAGCTGGWDGWIHLSGPNYPSPDASGGGGVTLDLATCKFKGYAWGGGDNANFPGWIHFAGFGYEAFVDPSACPPPGINVALQASPKIGDVVFSSQLIATVTNNVGSGPYTYRFDCDISRPPGLQLSGNAGADNFTTCTYTTRGTFTAQVEVSRLSASPGSATAVLIVKPPLPVFHEIAP